MWVESMYAWKAVSIGDTNVSIGRKCLWVELISVQ